MFADWVNRHQLEELEALRGDEATLVGPGLRAFDEVTYLNALQRRGSPLFKRIAAAGQTG